MSSTDRFYLRILLSNLAIGLVWLAALYLVWWLYSDMP